jgi:hypothetical protein
MDHGRRCSGEGSARRQVVASVGWRSPVPRLPKTREAKCGAPRPAVSLGSRCAGRRHPAPPTPWRPSPASADRRCDRRSARRGPAPWRASMRAHRRGAERVSTSGTVPTRRRCPRRACGESRPPTPKPTVAVRTAPLRANLRAKRGVHVVARPGASRQHRRNVVARPARESATLQRPRAGSRRGKPLPMPWIPRQCVRPASRRSNVRLPRGPGRETTGPRSRGPDGVRRPRPPSPAAPRGHATW